MTIGELAEKDSSFNSSIFTSKANNMVKKLYNATTLDQLDEVDHFASDSVFARFKSRVSEAKANNLRLIYDEVSVNTEIKDISEDINSYMINCLVTTKYCKYYIDNTGKVVQGDNKNRSTVIHNATFRKKKGASMPEVARCLGCGTPINVNENGKCPSCGRIFDLEEFDYYLEVFV